MRADMFGGVLACAAAVFLPLYADAAPLDSAVQELQRRVDEQEAIVRSLRRELDTLKQAKQTKQVGSIRPEGPTPATAPTQAQAETEPAPAAPPVSKPSAPGQVTATEEEAERALERTLTAEGALLLAYGRAEVEPSFSYTRRHVNVPALATLNGVTVPVNEEVRNNEFQPSLFARVGLPFDAQLEAGLPYYITEQQRVANVGATRVARSAHSGCPAGRGHRWLGCEQPAGKPPAGAGRGQLLACPAGGR